jgi:hypothetical protein
MRYIDNALRGLEMRKATSLCQIRHQKVERITVSTERLQFFDSILLTHRVENLALIVSGKAHTGNPLAMNEMRFHLADSFPPPNMMATSPMFSIGVVESNIAKW